MRSEYDFSKGKRGALVRVMRQEMPEYLRGLPSPAPSPERSLDDGKRAVAKGAKARRSRSQC